jgi:thiol-disulfide isomerase/thioredoxin
LALAAGFLPVAAAEPPRILDFELASLAGSFERLSALPAKPTLVNFWHSECPPCRKELPVIAAFAAKHSELRVVTVAVQPRRETERDADLLPPGGLHLIAPVDPMGLLARFGDPKGMLPYSIVLDAERRPCAAHAGEIDAAWLEAAVNRCRPSDAR